MKFLKQFFLFIVCVVAVVMILMLIAPTSQKVEKDTMINVPVKVVYDYLAKLENFNNWSVWSQSDSSIKNSITGIDGTTGAVNNWSGSPEISGEGSIQITDLKPNEEIKQLLIFRKPKAFNADSHFKLEDINGQTKVSWTFSMTTARPWNIFNLFSSLDKQMGEDFEKGLTNLKSILEKKEGTTPAVIYEVKPIDFPTTVFASYRQQVSMQDIDTFFSSYLPMVSSAIIAASASPGIPTGLYYEWDEKSKRTDMAVAFAVSAETKIQSDSINIITIAGSKAVSVDYFGAYDKTQAAYLAIDKYLAENKLKQKIPVIEQYLNDPQMIKDTALWHTKIIYLVE